MARYIDLSYPIWNGMPVFPGDPPVATEAVMELRESGYHVTRLYFGTHCGTHIDVPRHCIIGGKTVDEILPEKLVGPATIIDLGDLEPDSEITAPDLDRHAEQVPQGGRLLIKTGWGKRWGEPEFFTRFPGLTEGAAAWLTARKLVLVGLEQPSIHPRAHLAVHKHLLAEGTILIENLANLDNISEPEVLLVALPLKVKDGDGAPTRIIAIEGWVSSWQFSPRSEPA